MPVPRQIVAAAHEVDARLEELQLTREIIVEATWRGDVARRSAPPLGFKGHPEYAAGSEALNAICDLGGRTDGAWGRDDYLKIPVAMSFDRRVMISPTPGSEGTGQINGDPTNLAPKGPHSVRASATQPTLVEEVPPDFYWHFTLSDEHGLWVELFSPVMDLSGHAIDYVERIIIGNVDPGLGGRGQLPAIPPSPIVDISARL